MKPKLYNGDANNFGKNELNNHNNDQPNQNYLPLNYQFKFRYLNENVPETIDKSMDLPIDLSKKSIKRTSPEVQPNKLIEENHKVLDKNDNYNETNKSTNVNLINSNKNEAKLLPYLLMSNQPSNSLSNNCLSKIKENQISNYQKTEEPTTTFADADLLKYNKKKLFLASIRKRKQSSSLDNSSTISNLSTNEVANTFSSSSSSSSNSPNSTPSSAHLSYQLTNSDRRNSSSSTTSSTNLTLSPNSDNNLNDDLDNQHYAIKEFDLYPTQKNLFNNLPNKSFSKKFEFFAKHYEHTNGSIKEKLNGDSIDKSLNESNSTFVNDDLSNGVHSREKIAYNNKTVDLRLENGNSQNVNKLSNGNNKYFNCLKNVEKSLQRCNKFTKQPSTNLKRTLSETYLMDQKQPNVINLLTYKRKQLKKFRSEGDLTDLIKLCNREEQSTKQPINGDKISETSFKISKTTNHINGKSNKDQNKQPHNSHSVNYRQHEALESYDNEMKRLLIEKQILKKQEEFYLKNQNRQKEDDFMNYTKQLTRGYQKSFYPFNQFDQFNAIDKFSQFDKFNQIKSNSLPLNLQMNHSKTSLTFNNSQFLNTKPLINGQCNKMNEKVVGKRKFTKLASDEDEEDLEDEEENEENIIVDHLSNTASSVSPSSIQSNSDSSLINKQLMVKHHLDLGHHLERHPENGIDLRSLPFLNHPSHLPSHLNSLSRRTIQNKPPSFGNLPTDLLSNELIQSESALNSKDNSTSWKLYKDYYYLLNQTGSPAKLNALQWIMKDLNEKNNNHISLNDDWTEQELLKIHAYKQTYSIENNGPLNLTMFNNLNRSNDSSMLDSVHRQLMNTSRLDRQKFATNSPQPINLSNMQLTPENYLQYVKMNENILNDNRHLNNGSQLQILSGQSYLNLENSNSGHCMPPSTPNSFQDRKRISRPLTGRHVRQGTGASPTTLANLRSMIKERQKFRELNGGLSVNGKKFRKKRK